LLAHAGGTTLRVDVFHQRADTVKTKMLTQFLTPLADLSYLAQRGRWDHHVRSIDPPAKEVCRTWCSAAPMCIHSRSKSQLANAEFALARRKRNAEKERKGI
jgi:hypothetical protein